METVELVKVQFTKILGGIVADQVDSPLANVPVIEIGPDWQTVIYSTTTNAGRRWSLALVRIVDSAFHHETQRSSMQVKVTKRGKELRITLPVST